MPLRAGDRLGPFEIVAPLGTGGMGVVYRARDPRLGRDVAVKLLPDAGGIDPESRARLVREARTVASLNHPHICTVHEVGDVDGVPFIAMELVEGETLQQAIRRGRFTMERVCRLGRQLAQALEYAHASGVVHRDFKSANVILTADGRVKILDFGLALRAAAPTDLTQATQEAAPRLAGTLSYMAPELLQGSAATARSDIWALGMVLYEMASGRLPFERQTDSDLVAAILRDAPAPLPPGTPPGVARVIEKCLAKEPSERPAHASDVALALEIADPLAAGGRVAIEAGTRAWSMRSLAIGSVAAAALAGAAAYLVLAGRSAPEDAAIRFVNPTQVTTATGGVEEFAAWSPDGRTLAYAANPSGDPGSPAWDIWVTQPGGGAPINLTPDGVGRDLFPSWSPEGSQIAFWSDRAGAGCYVMPALGGRPRRVAAGSRFDPNPPQWSADGGELGCVNGDQASVQMEVVSFETGQVVRRIDLDVSETRRVTFATWTRDARALALVASTASLSADVNRLWVIQLLSKKAVPLTTGQTKVTSPSWSPDGRTLYYVANSGASADLWAQTLSADGTPDGPPRGVTVGIGMRNAALSHDGKKIAGPQGRRVSNVWRVPFGAGKPATWADAAQLTHDQAFIECVDVNRSGTRLAVSSDRAGSFDLWTLPAAGGDMQRLTTDPSAEWCPRWSPGGSMLAFFAHRTGNREVWTIPATGGAWRQITDNPGGVDMHPGWSADGKALLFLSQRDGWTGKFLQPLDGGAGRRVSDALSAQWSPVDRRLAYVRDERLWVAGNDGRDPPVRLPGAPAPGRLTWSADGVDILFQSQDENDDVFAVKADGRSPPRRLVALTGSRRGSIGVNGTTTDGKYVYYTWDEDLGDLWVITAEQR